MNPNSQSALSTVIRQVRFSTLRENSALHCKKKVYLTLCINIFNGEVHKEPSSYEIDFYVLCSLYGFG